MFEKFTELLKKRKEQGLVLPLHVALTVNGTRKWCEQYKEPYEVGYEKTFKNIKEIIDVQVKSKIRILSIYLLPRYMSGPDLLLKHTNEFFKELKNNSTITSNQVKISVIGKWYDLPSDTVESIKEIISETKDYDKFFLNFCINYNGQEEIVDACKLISKKVLAQKLDPDGISLSTIKDNIYTSYFIPPDMIIKTGRKKQLFSFFLWDSPRSEIIFTDKLFPNYSKDDFLKDIKSYDINL